MGEITVRRDGNSKTTFLGSTVPRDPVRASEDYIYGGPTAPRTCEDYVYGAAPRLPPKNVVFSRPDDPRIE